MDLQVVEVLVLYAQQPGACGLLAADYQLRPQSVFRSLASALNESEF